MQLKPKWDIILYLSEWLKWKMVTTLNADKDAEKLDHLYTTCGNIKWYGHSGTQLESFFYKIKHAITSWPCNCTLGHLSQRNKSICAHKQLYTDVHNSFICNSPKLQPAQMSLPHTMEHCSTKKMNKLLIHAVLGMSGREMDVVVKGQCEGSLWYWNCSISWWW